MIVAITGASGGSEGQVHGCLSVHTPAEMDRTKLIEFVFYLSPAAGPRQGFT